MEIKQIDDGVAVTGQLQAEDVPRLAELGYKVLVDNRPDTESGAVPHEEIRAAAEAVGMKFHYIPVVPGQSTAEAAEELAAVLASAEGPVLAYCRSGARSTNLYREAVSRQA
jgi:uncharacterized protein (TIGR01244 family)